jgi:small subunit ribosomal protein S20
MMRVAERKEEQNRPIRTAAKTQVSKTLRLIQSNELGLAKEAAKQAMSALDRAAQKGVIHPNNAARRKARLMNKLNKALASASDDEQ